MTTHMFRTVLCFNEGVVESWVVGTNDDIPVTWSVNEIWDGTLTFLHYITFGHSRMFGNFPCTVSLLYCTGIPVSNTEVAFGLDLSICPTAPKRVPRKQYHISIFKEIKRSSSFFYFSSFSNVMDQRHLSWVTTVTKARHHLNKLTEGCIFNALEEAFFQDVGG